MRTVYYVAEESPAKAKAIIAAVMAPNEKAEALGVLPEAAVEDIGLKPGDFKRSDDCRGRVDNELDEALKGTFPGSDPISLESPLVSGSPRRKSK